MLQMSKLAAAIVSYLQNWISSFLPHDQSKAHGISALHFAEKPGIQWCRRKMLAVCSCYFQVHCMIVLDLDVKFLLTVIVLFCFLL